MRTAFLIVGLGFALGATSAKANGLPSDGTIIGVYGDVLTEGTVIHDPTLNQSTVLNNSNTAYYSITNSTDPTLVGTPPQQATGSSLIWGSNSGGSDTFSELNFFGAPLPSDIHSSFLAGTFTFLNGTSALNSLIFGASISFYDNYVSPSDYLGTDTITITTTSNLNADLAQDADYINVCGNGSNICGKSIEAFEDSEGGTGVTVDLYATIVGDPQLEFTDVVLAPNQNPLTSGLVGDLPGIGSAVPEPSTWALLLLGFCGLGFAGYRKANGGQRRLGRWRGHRRRYPSRLGTLCVTTAGR